MVGPRENGGGKAEIAGRRTLATADHDDRRAAEVLDDGFMVASHSSFFGGPFAQNGRRLVASSLTIPPLCALRPPHPTLARDRSADRSLIAKVNACTP